METKTSDEWDLFVYATSTRNIEKECQKWSQIWEENFNRNSAISYSLRIWLEHLAHIGLDRIEFIDNDLKHVAINFSPNSNLFRIEFSKPECYPLQEPQWSCTFQPLFSKLRKRERAKYGIQKADPKRNFIKQLVDDFDKFIKDLDETLLEIKELDSFEFQIVGKTEDLSCFELDESEPNILIVRLKLKPTLANDFLDWIVVLYLDVNDILAYPNCILSEPLRPDVLESIDPSKWTSDRRLYDNLLTLFSHFLHCDSDYL